NLVQCIDGLVDAVVQDLKLADIDFGFHAGALPVELPLGVFSRLRASAGNSSGSNDVKTRARGHSASRSGDVDGLRIRHAGVPGDHDLEHTVADLRLKSLRVRAEGQRNDAPELSDRMLD